MPPYALLAFISAFGYSLGGLFNKQAMAEGSGLFRVTAFSIWASALGVLPFFFMYSEPLPGHLWFQPLLTAFFFLCGQVFFILALRTGDLSIVAPVAGAKPILNALLVAALLGVDVPTATWAACFLTAVALIVLRSPNASTGHSFLRTALITFMSAISFASCDTCFQNWAAEWGVLRFSSLAFGAASLGATALIPRFSNPWKQMNPSARRNTLIGAACCAVPGLLMGLALGKYGHGPEVNVVYGTRAVISILLVRFCGKWIGSREQHVSRGVFIRRIIGTAILMVAVGLVLFS
jgi:uncharacterized membrane protein